MVDRLKVKRVFDLQYGEGDWYGGPWWTVSRSEDSSIFDDAGVDQHKGP